jgi:hypothetical protein
LAAGMSVAGGVTAMFFGLLKWFRPLCPTFDCLECRLDCWSVVWGTALRFQLIFWLLDGVGPTLKISGALVIDVEATVLEDGLVVDIVSMG